MFINGNCILSLTNIFRLIVNINNILARVASGGQWVWLLENRRCGFLDILNVLDDLCYCTCRTTSSRSPVLTLGAICVPPTVNCLQYLATGSTLMAVAFSVAGHTVWNSLPDFIRDPTISADCFRCLLRTFCSLDTSAFSVLQVLDDNCTIQIYLLTYLLRGVYGRVCCWAGCVKLSPCSNRRHYRQLLWLLSGQIISLSVAWYLLLEHEIKNICSASD